MLLVALTLHIQTRAQADNFGTSGNEFSIDFVNIGNAGNAADTTGYGAVPYEYRMGVYEISQNQIDKATASGMLNVSAGPWTGNQPAANITWYEAAAFVNWLSTSTGKQAPYDLSWNGSEWSMSLWSSGDAWQLGGENLYRHKNAYYFLPSENEWYKAAYYSPNDSAYFLYPTGSNLEPLPLLSGSTQADSAYYGLGVEDSPVDVNNAGGLSPYGTMAQGGNAFDWLEASFDGVNDSVSENRLVRGGAWMNSHYSLSSHERLYSGAPDTFQNYLGFRVATVPEPSTYALLLMAGGCALWVTRRRTRRNQGQQ